MRLKISQASTVPEKGRSIRQKRLILLSGTLAFLFLGLTYGWSIFVSPLEKEFHWPRNQTSLIFLISVLSFTAGTIVSGWIIQRYHAAAGVVTAALFLLAGFVISSQIQELWQLFLGYGFCCSLGIGLAYNSILYKVLEQFHDRTGKASGLLLMGFGLGGFVLGSLVSLILYSPVGWRRTFMILGAAYFALLLWVAQIVHASPSVQCQDSGGGCARQDRDYSPGQVLRSRSYRWYIAWVTLASAIGLAIINIGAAFAIDMGARPALAAIAVGMISIGNGSGRLFFGNLYDRYGRAKAMQLANISYILATAAVWTAAALSSMALLLPSYLLSGFSYGSVSVFNSCFCRELYGARHLKRNLGLVNLFAIFSAPLGVYSGGVIKVQTGSYALLFVLLFAFSLADLLILSRLNAVISG